nr:hypothetical protein [Methanomassiliicoccales archaeon]
HGALSYQLIIDKPSYRDHLHFIVEYNGDLEKGKEEVLKAITGLEEIRSGLENDLIDPIEVEMREVPHDFTPKRRPIIDRRKRFDA